MKNLLIINGHEYSEFSKGKLNQTIFDEMNLLLSSKYEIKTTVVQKGYDVKEEQEKFKWADAVIFQTPIFWFSLPAMFKKYFDDVYEYGVFFGPADEYGKGGLMEGKKYMYSTTWNAPAYAFNNESAFLKGADLEEAISHLHYMQRYVDMEPLKSFSAHDVIANPDVDKYIRELKQHLQEVFNV
ncbi:NAD(P)H-dependent oxidoreductase [Cytobacillus spongiae]|uniref:NAD(P)H-dependent oxidoreductase n=1 Tax=Cytobacillus spongiae TaxID=2901381 RepID=UPI001F454B72|nr:NAD(P)H-dependent oxidoreductase [Cytobacillus spongiae]UII57558.1 NAD(P)H-dependent oxidoreductase [Cytobacillus spongiae]